MSVRLQVVLLRGYRRMPRLGRRWLVRWASPSYTVGAICLIERPDGHVLLIRQAYRDRWGLPGGLLKRREEPHAAVVREVREEVGLEIVPDGPPVVVVDAAPQRIDLVYRARLRSLQEVAAATPCSPEIRDLAWFPLDALPDLQPETATALASLGVR